MTTATATPEPTPGELTAVELLQREPAVRRLHPAQDVLDGVLWYGRPVEGRLVLLNSARQALRSDELPAGLALRHADPGPAAMSREAATRWAQGEAHGSLAVALDALAALYTRGQLQDAGTPRRSHTSWTC